ncbi:pentatricopeptide repeat (PPR) superfamily protein [Wolffia australiana]
MIVDARHCFKLLQSCHGGQALQQGKRLHLSLLKSGLLSSLYWANRILQIYTRFNPEDDAPDKLFEEIPLKNSFSWNTLIDSHLKSGRTELSVQLFHRTPLKNTFSWNLIISGLAKANRLETAHQLFEAMPEKDPVAFNCVLHGYIRHGRSREALRLYKRAKSRPWEDRFVLATALSACARSLDHRCGAQIHARILTSGVEFDAHLGSSLVDMYSKCGVMDGARASLEAMAEPDEFSVSSLVLGYADRGRLEEAIRVFERWYKPEAVLWNSLLNGYAGGGHGLESMELFRSMARGGVAADSSSFTAVLAVSSLLQGRQIHGRAIRSGLIEDVAVRTSLLGLYAKAGSLKEGLGVFEEASSRDVMLVNAMIAAFADDGRVDDARGLFEGMTERTGVSWNSMVVGYAKNGFPREALELFSEMLRGGVSVDGVSLAAAVSACAGVCSLRAGEQVFALAVAVGLQSDGVVSTALIDLHCKCGFPGAGRVLFEGMESRDLAAWNAMLSGYAANGLGLEALNLFEKMRLRPDRVTFLALLSGCCHCGLVEQGQRLLSAMETDFEIAPAAEHYACAVDLLVRAGKTEEAFMFIDAMPVKEDAVVLTSLLRGCRAQGQDSLANQVAERLISLHGGEPGVYLQLSSLCAGRGLWDKSLNLRRVLKQRKIVKIPGTSWTD